MNMMWEETTKSEQDMGKVRTERVLDSVACAVGAEQRMLGIGLGGSSASDAIIISRMLSKQI